MTIGLNPRLELLKESTTIRVADRIRQLERQGRKITKLQTGDPDFATPAPIIEAARQAMKDGLTHYSDSRGLPELRLAIAERLGAESKLDFDPAQEIQVTHGAVHAI